jgi:hypothetical protein
VILGFKALVRMVADVCKCESEAVDADVEETDERLTAGSMCDFINGA